LVPPEQERYALGRPLARFRLSAAQPLKDLEHCIWFDVWEPGANNVLSCLFRRGGHTLLFDECFKSCAGVEGHAYDCYEDIGEDQSARTTVLEVPESCPWG
jgi:hypothetical protein